MYFCPSFIARVDDSANGSNAREIWDEFRCNDWEGNQIVYMDHNGDTVDRGDMDGEQCSDHHTGYWEDNITGEAYRTLIDAGWTACPDCVADGFDERDAPLFMTEGYLEDHAETEHGERHVEIREEIATLVAQVEGNPTPNILDTAMNELRAQIPPTWGTPIIETEQLPNGQVRIRARPDRAGTPERVTRTMPEPPPLWPENQPGIFATNPNPRVFQQPPVPEWHTEPPITDDQRRTIEEYFRMDYRTNYLNNPIGNYVGARVHDLSRQFRLIRSELEMQLAPATDWTLVRFMPGPARTARSTTSMWEAVAS